MAELGFRTIDSMVGRTDVLDGTAAIEHWKADGLDLTQLLAPAQPPHDDVDVVCTRKQEHGLEFSLDRTQLLDLARPALERQESVRAKVDIVNINRTVGTILSHEIAKRYGESGLSDGTIHFEMHGSAGESFGAFLTSGVTMELVGDANNYVGKGLSGGRLVIYPSPDSSFKAEDNIIVGNVVLYGATRGEAFFRGCAAERFCVRNSGALAVIEGVGDHGCEYMTGGRVVILGPVGRNFAAGMSGGIAYVWDPEGELLGNCNLGMVELEHLGEDDEALQLRDWITRHQQWTGSEVAERILGRWSEAISEFVKVMPTDYKRVLEAERAKQQQATSPG